MLQLRQNFPPILERRFLIFILVHENLESLEIVLPLSDLLNHLLINFINGLLVLLGRQSFMNHFQLARLTIV